MGALLDDHLHDHAGADGTWSDAVVVVMAVGLSVGAVAGLDDACAEGDVVPVPCAVARAVALEVEEGIESEWCGAVVVEDLHADILGGGT